MVQGTENSVELNYLNSLTEYQVAVFAVYHSSASEALRGSAITCKFIRLQGYTEDMRCNLASRVAIALVTHHNPPKGAEHISSGLTSSRTLEKMHIIKWAIVNLVVVNSVTAKEE